MHKQLVALQKEAAALGEQAARAAAAADAERSRLAAGLRELSAERGALAEELAGALSAKAAAARALAPALATLASESEELEATRARAARSGVALEEVLRGLPSLADAASRARAAAAAAGVGASLLPGAAVGDSQWLPHRHEPPPQLGAAATSAVAAAAVPSPRAGGQSPLSMGHSELRQLAAAWRGGADAAPPPVESAAASAQPPPSSTPPGGEPARGRLRDGSAVESSIAQLTSLLGQLQAAAHSTRAHMGGGGGLTSSFTSTSSPSSGSSGGGDSWRAPARAPITTSWGQHRDDDRPLAVTSTPAPPGRTLHSGVQPHPAPTFTTGSSYPAPKVARAAVVDPRLPEEGAAGEPASIASSAAPPADAGLREQLFARLRMRDRARHAAPSAPRGGGGDSGGGGGGSVQPPLPADGDLVAELREAARMRAALGLGLTAGPPALGGAR